jgi:hypothetical protein
MATQITKDDFLSTARLPGVEVAIPEEAQIIQDICKVHDLSCQAVATLWPFASPKEILVVLNAIANAWDSKVDELAGYEMLVEWAEDEGITL